MGFDPTTLAIVEQCLNNYTTEFARQLKAVRILCFGSGYRNDILEVKLASGIKNVNFFTHTNVATGIRTHIPMNHHNLIPMLLSAGPRHLFFTVTNYYTWKKKNINPILMILYTVNVMDACFEIRKKC